MATARRVAPDQGARIGSLNVRTAGLIGVLLALAGCDRRPVAPTIGLAYGRFSPGVVDVVTDELREAAARGGPPIGVFQPVDRPQSDTHEEIDRAATIVARPGTVAAVGHASSRESLLAAPIYAEAGVPEVVPSGTSRRLRSVGPWTFSIAPDDSAEGAFIAGVAARKLRARSLTIFYSADEYGTGLRDGVVTAMGERGMTLVDQSPVTETPRCEDPRQRAGLAAVVEASLRHGVPDAIVLATRTGPSACIIRLLRPLYPRLRFICGDATEPDAAFLQLAGPAADSALGVVFWHPDIADSASRAFVTRFRRLVGREPAPQDAMIFDAMMLVAAAIREGNSTRSQVRDYLRALGVTRPPYQGISGPVSFAPNRVSRLYLFRVAGGTTRLEPER